jgi:hypothetical protein
METDEQLFQRFQPRLNEVTEAKAAEFFYSTHGIQSLNGKLSAIDAFTLVLATDSEQYGPYVLNAVSARALCRLLMEHGFGPVKS